MLACLRCGHRAGFGSVAFVRRVVASLCRETRPMIGMPSILKGMMPPHTCSTGRSRAARTSDVAWSWHTACASRRALGSGCTRPAAWGGCVRLSPPKMSRPSAVGLPYRCLVIRASHDAPLSWSSRLASSP